MSLSTTAQQIAVTARYSQVANTKGRPANDGAISTGGFTDPDINAASESTHVDVARVALARRASPGAPK
jgi:predicted rRNA methylase YqxC with S4 and FtsJ domains